MINKNARTLGRTGQGMLEVLKSSSQNTNEEGQLGNDEAKPAVVLPQAMVRTCECLAGLWWPGWSETGLLATFMPQPLLWYSPPYDALLQAGPLFPPSQEPAKILQYDPLRASPDYVHRFSQCGSAAANYCGPRKRLSLSPT